MFSIIKIFLILNKKKMNLKNQWQVTRKKSKHFSKKSALACLLLLPYLALGNNDPARPLVPMSEYSGGEYRTLNCWECFEARGRICHNQDYKVNY